MSAIVIRHRIHVIDSHTGGEPTRVVLSGGPDLGRCPASEQWRRLRDRHDWFRAAVVNEPRGSDVQVGALLGEPIDPTCLCSVVFFNNVGYLGMCVHGTIGVIATLAYLGRIATGEYRLETPVGPVAATLRADGRVSVRNVPSFRHASGVIVPVDGCGTIVGDVAWGGNWFFLAEHSDEAIRLSNVERLTDLAWRIRQSLARHAITGVDGAEVDHIELFGPPSVPGADSKNFVLCPGKAYDRSPCGTGTSAKLACLMADGRLAPGETWRQESIVGSVFEARGEFLAGQVIPTITGSAFITADATLLLQEDDPYQAGIPA